MKHFTKLFFSLCFMLILNLGSQAQIWAPQGAKWYYSYSAFGLSGYISIENTKDTLIFDHAYGQFRNCQKLSKTRYSYGFGGMDTISLGSEYTWSSDDTVFIYRHDQFYVLYDFSAQPGDSWVIPETYNFLEYCDSVGVVNVVAAGDTILNSEVLRYIVVEPEGQSHWVLSGMIIEKIGPLWYMLPEQACILDYMEGGPLRCYQDSIFQYSSGIAPYCDFIVGIKEPDNNSFMIYPNPAIHNLSIKCIPYELYDLAITSIHGKTVMEFFNVGNGTTIDINGIAPGFYILLLRKVNSDIIKTQLQIIKK